jgi:hypothetical protein
MALTLVGTTESRSTPHRQGKGYKRPKPTKHTTPNTNRSPSAYIQKGDLAPK